ncbi:MAG: hypothetical protein M3440_07350 [Chloroflexota bacterium]|nr:hypothetical protein [Chloroflexota bacterium]
MPTSEIINYRSGGVRVLVNYAINGGVSSIDVASTIPEPTHFRVQMADGAVYEIAAPAGITISTSIPAKALTVTVNADGEPHVNGLGAVTFWTGA